MWRAARADSFCSGCRVTPYCSALCQRRDWAEWHWKVCHNLRRQSGGASRADPEPEAGPAAAAPLRRPRSPDGSRDGAGSDRAPPRRFGPPGSAVPAPNTNNQANRNARTGFNRGPNSDWQGVSARLNRSTDGDEARPQNTDRTQNRDRNQQYYNRKNEDKDNRRNQDGDDSRNQGQGSSGYNKQENEDEDWGPKLDQKLEAKPVFKPKSPLVQKEEHKIEAKLPAAATASRPIASAADVLPTPVRKWVPKNCVIDLLPIKDTFMLTADAAGEGVGGTGFICVTLHAEHSASYERLLDPFSQSCEASEPCEPRPGDTFAYLNPEDGGWYRARCLAPSRAALVDACRVVRPAADQCRRLPTEYADIPEFCCQLDSDKIQLNDKIQCTIISKSGDALNVSLVNLDTQAPLGNGTVRRWLPTVEWPQEPARGPTAAAEATTASPAASAPKSGPSVVEPPQVPRPPVTNNSSVLLIDATEPSRVFVRPAARDKQGEFNDLVCEIALYGADESTPRLNELPTAGQTVLARFTDDLYYRALVQRVSSKHKRCLLEYIEYGNAAIVDNLSTLCPCPPQFDLAARPTLASVVTLQMTQAVFSEAATAYIEKLKDDCLELTLTIPSGAQSGPSKTPVRLAVTKSGEDVNRTLDTLSTPEWRRLLDRGGDVLEVEKFSFADITYVDPPCAGELVVTDCSLLHAGVIAGHARNAPHAKRAFALAPRMEEYCKSALAADPYLPNLEELCIAFCPIKKQWLRAALIQQKGGPGGAEVKLLFYDYGHMATVSVSALRKMMPEFARDPAGSCQLEIKDFPTELTPAQLGRARRHLQADDAGAGVLRAARCSRLDVGEYVVEAPELVRAVMQ